MVYNYTSSEIVIADVLDKTRMTDTTYADSMFNWLKECMGFVRIRRALEPAFKPIEIVDHIGDFPCGMVSIDAITYNGFRLPKGTGVTDVRIAHNAFIKENLKSSSYFVSDVTSDGYTKNEQSYLLVRGDDIRSALGNGFCTDYYIPYPRHIQTSFESGCVMLYYRKAPVDKKGYPLIPDESYMKIACFWYIMAMLTISGYKHASPRMDYEFCMGEHTRYLKEAKKVLGAPSQDDKEAFKNMWVSLLPPAGYYDRFGIGYEAANGFT